MRVKGWDERGVGIGRTYSLVPLAQIVSILVRNRHQGVFADEVYDACEALEEGFFAKGQRSASIPGEGYSFGKNHTAIIKQVDDTVVGAADAHEEDRVGLIRSVWW